MSKGKKAIEEPAASDAGSVAIQEKSDKEQKIVADVAVFTNHPVRKKVTDGGETTNDLSSLVLTAGSGGSVVASESVAMSPGSGINLADGSNAVRDFDNKQIIMRDQRARAISKLEFEGYDDQTNEGDYVARKAISKRKDLSYAAPGTTPVAGQIYDRQCPFVSADKLVATFGQIDKASIAYDSFPKNDNLNGTSNAATSKLRPSNYHIKAINMKIVDGALDDVTFDVEEISTDTGNTVLDYIPLSFKDMIDVAEQDIKTYKETLFKPDDKQHVIPAFSKETEAAQKLVLERAVVGSDGPIAYAVVKSLLETNSYIDMLSKMLGGNKAAAWIAGSVVAGSGSAITRISGSNSWITYPMFGREGASSKYGATTINTTNFNHSSKKLDLNAVAVINLFSGGIREGQDSLASLQQQKGLQNALSQAAKAFENFDFRIPEMTKSYMDKMFGWYADSEYDTIIGVSDIGFILPYNPNELFKFRTVLDGSVKELDSVVHSIANSDQDDVRYGAIMSPFWYNFVKFFQEDVLKRIHDQTFRNGSGTSLTTTITIPVAFSTRKFTPFTLLAALSFGKYGRNTAYDYINGQYKEFMIQYPNVDIMNTPGMTKLSLSDVVSTASFRGLGVNPVLTEATSMLKYMISDPEYLAASCTVKDATNFGYFVGQIVMHDMIGCISDDYAEDSRWKMLAPMFIKGTQIIPAVKRLLGMTPAQMRKTADKPICPYDFIATGKGHVGLMQGDSNITVIERTTLGATGAMRMMNVLPIYGQTRSLTANDSVSVVKLPVSGVLSPRRTTGIVFPAPLDMVGSGLNDVDFISTVNVFELKGGSDLLGGGLGYDQKVNIKVKPIETYHITYLLDPTDMNDAYKGSATYGDMLSINTGLCSKSDLTTLANTYGIYLDPTADYVAGNFDIVTSAYGFSGNMPIAVAASWDDGYDQATYDAFDDKTSEEAVAYLTHYHPASEGTTSVTAEVQDTISIPRDLAIEMWALNYAYPFIHSPFEGLMDTGDVKAHNTSVHVQDDFTTFNRLSAMTNFKGHVILDYSREADKDESYLLDDMDNVDHSAVARRDNMWF
jgi:hypothetical protein